MVDSCGAFARAHAQAPRLKHTHTHPEAAAACCACPAARVRAPGSRRTAPSRSAARGWTCRPPCRRGAPAWHSSRLRQRRRPWRRLRSWRRPRAAAPLPSGLSEQPPPTDAGGRLGRERASEPSERESEQRWVRTVRQAETRFARERPVAPKVWRRATAPRIVVWGRKRAAADVLPVHILVQLCVRRPRRRAALRIAPLSYELAQWCGRNASALQRRLCRLRTRPCTQRGVCIPPPPPFPRRGLAPARNAC